MQGRGVVKMIRQGGLERKMNNGNQQFRLSELSAPIGDSPVL